MKLLAGFLLVLIVLMLFDLALCLVTKGRYKCMACRIGGA